MRMWTITIGVRPAPPGTNSHGTRLRVHVCADDRDQARLSALDFAGRAMNAIGEPTEAVTVDRVAVDPPRRWDENTLRGRRSGEVYFVELSIGVRKRRTRVGPRPAMPIGLGEGPGI